MYQMMLVAALGMGVPANAEEYGLKMDVIDVGQGLSILFESDLLLGHVPIFDLALACMLLE